MSKCIFDTKKYGIIPVFCASAAMLTSSWLMKQLWVSSALCDNMFCATLKKDLILEEDKAPGGVEPGFEVEVQFG